MTYAEYLNKMTVKELSEIAKRMNLSYSGKRKAELVAKINEYVAGWHMIAKSMNRSLHTDVKSVIDTEEFPMDHSQFTVWYNRHGGIDSFDAMKALGNDHIEALEMNDNLYESPHYEYAGVKWTGPVAVMLRKHDEMLRRYNPTLRRDKEGQIILTAKQRRRIHKKDRRNSKRLGLWENAA